MRDLFMTKLNGPEGIEKRKKTEEVSKRMRIERAEGGESWKEMMRLAKIGVQK